MIGNKDTVFARPAEMPITEGGPAKPCASCWYWEQQKRNRHMGWCKFQLPGSISEVVGSSIMAKGSYIWVESVGRCYTYRPSQGKLP